MKIRALFIVIGIAGFLFATDSFAQPMMKWRGSGGWGPGSQYGGMYNPNTVETITGEVVKIEQLTPMKVMSYGVHLVVKTQKETVDVHLGPAWYIENQDVKITAGDKIEIKGSRITFQGKPVIIATEVKKGEEILKLRDEKGFPVWAGWRRSS
jgi:hypothetical protein